MSYAPALFAEDRDARAVQCAEELGVTLRPFEPLYLVEEALVPSLVAILGAQFGQREESGR